MSIFEKATRLQLRFTTPIGALSVEDLWELPLKHASKPNLDGIAIPLYKQLQDSTPISFVDASSASGASDLIKLKFDVVKHIIDTKKAEQAHEAERSAAKKQDQKILALLAEHDDDALRKLTPEQLRARLSSAQTSAETA